MARHCKARRGHDCITGEGDTYAEALADVRSAIQCHIEEFGADAFVDDSPVLEAFVAETEIAV